MIYLNEQPLKFFTTRIIYFLYKEKFLIKKNLKFAYFSYSYAISVILNLKKRTAYDHLSPSSQDLMLTLDVRVINHKNFHNLGSVLKNDAKLSNLFQISPLEAYFEEKSQRNRKTT